MLLSMPRLYPPWISLMPRDIFTPASATPDPSINVADWEWRPAKEVLRAAARQKGWMG
jgi:hypothetical protein